MFLSVDPYMRPYTKRMNPPFTMIGSSVAEVEETRNPNFKKGQTIVILAGWVERGIVNPDAMGKVDTITVLLCLISDHIRTPLATPSAA